MKNLLLNNQNEKTLILNIHYLY